MSITVTVAEGLGLAKVLARRDTLAVLHERFQAQFAVVLPAGPERVTARDIAAVGLGPGVWLAIRERGGNHWARDLKAALGDSASVSDQSDAYVMHRLSGPGLRETLAKLLPIDLHDRVFAPDRVAETLVSHMGVILWRLEDTPEGDAVFEIAVGRSYLMSFRHVLASIAPDSNVSIP
jgi:sarcosine oxidase subunit gamma